MKPSLVEEEEEEEEGAILLHWEDLIVHLLPHILNRMPTAASEVVQPLRDGQTPKTNHLAWLGWAGGYDCGCGCCCWWKDTLFPSAVLSCCVVLRIFKATVI